ncbi:hypothetical protein Tco_0017732 [Tanacetum coccineum]
MANLEFCDTHNMVAYLHNTEGSEGFHQIVDFLNTSHIKDALTKNPTIHVSLIQQFWQTTAANTLDSGEVQITAIIDGKVKLVFEVSIRRHLKLEDSDGITTFPNTEIFEQLTLMGPILQGERSTVLVESHHIPSADEAAFTSVDVVHGGAVTTISSINAGQGSGNLPKSPTMPHESPFPGGHIPRSDEGISNDEESSEDPSKQGRMIEDIDQDAKISLVTPIKVNSQEDQSKDQLGVLCAAKVLAYAAKKNINTYTRRRRVVSTGSEGVGTASRIFSTVEESVSTAGTSMPVSSAGMVQQVNIIIPSSSETTKTTKDKGKATMQESEQPKKIKIEKQEAKFNAEQEKLLASETTKDEVNSAVANIDWDDVQAQIQVDEDLAQKLLEEEKENLSIKERARLLAELINKRKKLQAAQ